jgi:hypothetical protein
MAKFPRYTSFKPGELETALREIAPDAIFVPTGQASGPSPHSRLIKEYTFAVTYPDGVEGSCRYERGGPTWHLYHFLYRNGAPLPRQTVTSRLGNDIASIEAKGRERVAACYQEAIRRERETYFQRASEPSDGSRKKRPDRYCMKADKAKELSGLYAVCRVTRERLWVEGTMYRDLEKANAEWRERGDIRLVVACCNRLDRCWEVMRFNPLYAEVDPRDRFFGTGGERL